MHDLDFVTHLLGGELKLLLQAHIRVYELRCMLLKVAARRHSSTRERKQKRLYTRYAPVAPCHKGS
eukprot:1192471-Prorocentrum_minimum.AAC.3